MAQHIKSEKVVHVFDAHLKKVWNSVMARYRAWEEARLRSSNSTSSGGEPLWLVMMAVNFLAWKAVYWMEE